MTIFTRAAQSKIDALPPASRPSVVPAILRAYDAPQITYADSRTDAIHRIHGDVEVIVSPDTDKIITFKIGQDREPEAKPLPKRLTYRERHLAAQKGRRR